MVFHPLEERVISGPDTYDLLNNVEVGNYNQTYYIEKEDFHINYVMEDEDDDSIKKEPEDTPHKYRQMMILRVLPTLLWLL